MFPYTDSATEESVPRENFDAYQTLKYETVYEQITKASPDVKTFEIKPSHCDMKQDICIHIKDLEGLCNSIKTLCRNNEEKYLFAYFDNPDGINHKKGWDSKDTQDFILHAEELFEDLTKELKNTDTLLIMSADHGHNNITTNYNSMDLEELSDCYIMPPSLEPRFVSFWIKPEKLEFFKEKFNEKFNKEFILFTKEEFLASNLLGYGVPHPKIDDFLGDYIAIAISDSAINIKTALSKERNVKLSNHCGLTENEMEVPLIVFDMK